MTADIEQVPRQTRLTHLFSFYVHLFRWYGKCWWLAPLCFSASTAPVKTACFGGAVSQCLPSLLISMPPAALRIPAGQWLACCYFIPSLWVSTKAAKLLRNMFWAAKGLTSFAPSLYPALLTNSWPWSNDLFQGSGLWDTKMLLFLSLPFSI